LLLNADGSSLENSSEAKFIDVFGLIVPIADGVCEYFLTNLVTRPEKELGAAGLPCSEEVELFHHGKHDERSDGFRVMATEAASSHSRTFRSRQSCESNSATIFRSSAGGAKLRSGSIGLIVLITQCPFG
jgi:hypothetical protein